MRCVWNTRMACADVTIAAKFASATQLPTSSTNSSHNQYHLKTDNIYIYIYIFSVTVSHTHYQIFHCFKQRQFLWSVSVDPSPLLWTNNIYKTHHLPNVKESRSTNEKLLFINFSDFKFRNYKCVSIEACHLQSPTPPKNTDDLSDYSHSRNCSKHWILWDNENRDRRF